MFELVWKIPVSLLLLRFRRKKQKKVLLVAEFGKSGGTRTYFIYLLHFLHQQGYKVMVIAANAKSEDEEIIQLLKEYKYSLIPTTFDFWCINLNEVPEGLSKMDLIRYQFRELQFWCDLQLQHRFSHILLTVAYPEKYLYIFLLPVRIIYIVHSYALKKADKYKQLLLSLFLSPRKKILTVSLFAKRSIEQYWLKNRQNKFVEYIYNYYAPKFRHGREVTCRHELQVLTIGSVESYKNPLLFVETAKAVIAANKGVSIGFVWAGAGSMIDTCRRLVADYPQIRFIGNVEDVESLYVESDVYYQPSLLESHGIAVLGAMYHRLPCVVSEHGGLKESVEDGKSGYVVSVNDVEASVEKINKLLTDHVLSTKMGEYGQQIFAERFSRDIWYREMCSLFKI